MTADDDPRLRMPGPPGGQRYLCPLTVDGRPCPWYLDVPPPEIEHELGPEAYRVAITEVPMERIEEAIAAHLATHEAEDLTGEMVRRLRAIADRPRLSDEEVRERTAARLRAILRPLPFDG